MDSGQVGIRAGAEGQPHWETLPTEQPQPTNYFRSLQTPQPASSIPIGVPAVQGGTGGCDMSGRPLSQATVWRYLEHIGNPVPARVRVQFHEEGAGVSFSPSPASHTQTRPACGFPQSGRSTHTSFLSVGIWEKSFCVPQYTGVSPGGDLSSH